MPKYIDADALKEAFLIEGKDVYDDTDEFDTKWGASQELIEKVIDSVPAADVEPVRHGRWIPHETIDGFSNGVQCSVCGEWFYKYFTYNYCPDCGAKMDAEPPKEEKE